MDDESKTIEATRRRKTATRTTVVSATTRSANKLEEAEKANARGMSGCLMETKEEIFAKKVQLENRIRATFGASGDHDAVERIALGEAAHPHTLQLMQTAFTTPEFTATIEKEEETPRDKERHRREEEGLKEIRARRRERKRALCAKKARITPRRLVGRTRRSFGVKSCANASKMRLWRRSGRQKRRSRMS